jgi:hypothetical protein
MQYLLLLTSLLLARIQVVTAQAETCDINSCLLGYQTLGPSDSLQCYVDPTDSSKFALLTAFCPCEENDSISGYITYNGLDGALTTASPVNTQYAQEAFVWQTFFQTYNVPVTAILPGSPVTVDVNIGGDIEGIFTFTQSQSQSIFKVATTSTLINYVGSVSCKALQYQLLK